MRRAHALPLFGLCAAALVAVMGWLTARVRELERERQRAREEATLEESVRLALWRMESRLAPLLAQENARSPHAYALAAEPAPFVRAHLEWTPASEGQARREAQAPRLPAREAALYREFMASGAQEALLASLSSDWLPAVTEPRAPPAPAPAPVVVAKAPPGKSEAPPSALLQQQALSEKEYKARLSNAAVLPAEANRAPRQRAATSVRVRFARLAPVWMGDELLLARRVEVGSGLRVQACWLDWPELRAMLLRSIEDLLPAAALTSSAVDANPARRLAALPVSLVPGNLPATGVPSTTAERLPLVAAWSLAALALVASGALLLGLATLGERRAAFVSAVTHELRTPLTTFRMYADLLAEGMVPAERQGEYLATLRREAERQGHLVENVLAYSRLERGRYRAARETLSLGELIAGLFETLAAQARRASLELQAPPPGDWREVRVSVDRAAVERVLFNLVDNACKYARGAGDPRLHLLCHVDPRDVRLELRDHGPGVSAREARRLFRPFHKSARDAAQSAPGVGLGLALSRRLARAIGGDLRLERGTGPGATFSLRLPRA